jgi:hypothetical protein
VDIVELARTHTPAAINALAAALDSPRERVPAAIALLDRGWGKATQLVIGDEERPIAIHFSWAAALPDASANPTAPTIDAVAEAAAGTNARAEPDDTEAGGITVTWQE